jgi:hypothetical protein
MTHTINDAHFDNDHHESGWGMDTCVFERISDNVNDLYMRLNGMRWDVVSGSLVART